MKASRAGLPVRGEHLPRKDNPSICLVCGAGPDAPTKCPQVPWTITWAIGIFVVFCLIAIGLIILNALRFMT